MPTFAGLSLSNPVLAAPMAGGPTTPALVTAAAAASSLGFLAGGYRTVEQLGDQIRQVRSATSLFGVNLFAPDPVPVDPGEYTRYAIQLVPAAARFDVLLPPRPIQDDDGWAAKLDLLLTDPVPLVSFTFGLPPADAVRALHRAGSAVVQTVTSAQEARWAQDVGVDLLIVQGPGAGGHSAVFDPSVPITARALPELVRDVATTTRLPLIAAGGLASSEDVAEVLHAGAAAAMVGTALLLADEAGTSAVHLAAIAGRSGPTVMTRAFTGRPARALPNEFTRRFDPIAPPGYPALHHLTSPLRKAAAAVGDAEWVHLWAGTGYQGTVSGSVGAVLSRLANA
jgi:NAD(P)H-dependent flavin oxidoreductase YrpB (nitropropane dioxygenase family)